MGSKCNGKAPMNYLCLTCLSATCAFLACLSQCDCSKDLLGKYTEESLSGSDCPVHFIGKIIAVLFIIIENSLLFKIYKASEKQFS